MMNTQRDSSDTNVIHDRITESWFDASGRTVKQKQGGRRGYSVSEYKPNGEIKRTAQLSDSGEILAESMPLFDRRGRNIGGMQKSRRVKGRKQGRHVLPKDFGADQTSASRYTRQWFDPIGRVIASGDYGFVEANAQPVSDYISQSSETVRVSRTVYDPETGRVLGYIDSEGRETRTEVDAMGRTLKVIANFKGRGVFNPEKPDENITTEMRYDISGKLVWKRDAAGNVTQQVYDKLGRLVAAIAPNGGRTLYEYDQVGQTIAVTDPMGRTTRFEYDTHGRRIKTILPKPAADRENPVQETVYNELGQVEAQVDPLGNTTRFEYDEMGRTVRQIDANGGVTTFEYDDEGKLLSLTDPVGNTTRYEYDELGRVEKETNEFGKSRLFEYTPSGALLEKTDRNGRVTAFKYTRFGQVAEERWLTGKRMVGRISFDYDQSGRLAKVSDSSGSFEYKHDVLGRSVSETIALAGLKQKVSFHNTFDVLGRRTSQTALIGQSEDYTNRWTYNDLGQVDTISHGRPSIEPKQAVYSYDKAGARTGVAVSSSENEVYRSEFAYDGMGRLEGIHYVNPAAETLAKYGLTWDPASRITAMNLDGEPAKYGYDATSQLTSATYEKLPDEAYEYDANGNRTNFETGRNNQLTFDGENRYTYDDEGNRITKGKMRYFWDHRNRLVKVVTLKKTIEYQYDYRNRLTRRNDEFFVHDGWQIVCSLKNGKVVDRYFWGARQDELLCENNDFVLTDHLGTVRKTVGRNGETVSELEYNAFGKVISSGWTLPMFHYTGKMFDNNTGLQWNINRWYDADVGRWISEDTIGFFSLDTNISRYVYNLLVSHIDYLGLVDSTYYMIQNTEIAEEKHYIVKDPSGKILHECYITLIPDRVEAGDVGQHCHSDLFAGVYGMIKSHEQDGKCYCHLKLYAAGCAYAIAYPVNTDHARSYWKLKMTSQIYAPVLNAIGISPPHDNNDINTFQSAVIKHENNHVHPFTLIKDNILCELDNLESQVFECDLKKNTYQDPENVIAKTIAKLVEVWSAAMKHSASMDSDPEKRVPSFISYPLSPVFDPPW